MRNLKRVLSLALALVMVLGMMVITTSAATYTDAEEITYTEAVEVMSKIGILKGMGDGTFAPKATLNRAQAAKIVAFVCLGADADDYLTGSTQSFEDMDAPGVAWAEKYVAYCKNLGIIDGVGDNKFNPTGTLKTVEFAKMLLVALNIEGTYTGAGWANNVKTAAKDIVDVIDIDTTEVTREEACAMALAAMTYTTTSTSYDVIVDGEIEKSFDSLLDAKLWAASVNDALEAEVASVDTNEATDYLLNENYSVECTVAADGGVDTYGRKATVYSYTDEEDETKNWTLTYVTEKAVKTYSAATKANAIAKDLKGYKVGTDAVENTTVKKAWTGTGSVRVDGAAAKTIGNTVTLSGKTLSEALAALTGDNKVVEIYANKDKEITKIVIVNTLYSTVAEVSEPDEDGVVTTTLADSTTYVTDAYEEGDVVKYTKDANGVVEMTKLEGFTGTLSGYTKDGKFTIGEKVYELSEVALVEDSAVIAAMGEEMVYTLDVNGKIVAVAEPEGAVVVAPVITDYAVVLDSNAKVETKAAEWPATGSTTTITAQIQVLLADGTVEIWDVAVAKADKDIKVNGETKVSKNEYYFAYGKQYVVVAITEAEGTEAAAANKTAVEEALIENATGVWTYADKALVAPVATELTEATVEKTTVLSGEIDAIDATSYVVDDVILNDKTVFILKDTNEQTGKESIVVKTGLAALESTSSFTGLIVATYTPAFDENKELDAENCTTVATLVFAQDVEFDATIEPAEGTDDLVFVDENYAVSVVGQDTFHTYSVVYADGSADTIAVKVTDDYSELDTGVYYLMDDGSIDVETGILVSATLKVKIISGTTVILVDGEENLSAMTTNAKTVVVGGELEVGAEAYVVAGDNNTIALAFIVE